jgi:proteasome assembly chaperone (PAC2) family protein
VLDPVELYEVAGDAPDLQDPVLLLGLDGFVDAGNATQIALAALREGQEPRVVARFDVDQLIDYRSRRPALQFDTDHWSGYYTPALEMVALSDTGRTDYLLLSGPEPDSQWERFIAAVEQLVRRFRVRLVIGLASIPLAVPHTRPIGVTVHGTRSELTEGHQAWFTTAEVPGSAANLLEYRFGERGLDAMGFAAHVPHYLARLDYPQAARVLLDHVGLAAGLFLPTESLSKAAQRTDAEIAEQVAESEEVAQVVRALEKQYDAVASGRRERAAGGLGGQLPTADELAAEVERYLADQDGDDEPTA